MRIPLSWLNALLQPALDPETVERSLLTVGLEVESLEYSAPRLETVVVGQIVAIAPHPNADKLRICQTDIGEAAPLQIVTGAANVQLHDKIPVARVGSNLPGDKRIEAAKLRGVESFGMYCSLAELGLPPGEDGVHILPADTLIGQPIAQAMQLGELVLEIAITANRPDLLSVEGVARELAVANPHLTLLQSRPKPLAGKPGPAVRLGPVEASRCPLYRGVTVRGVRVAPSPEWLANRLSACGIRPINNIVDASNYVMLLTGQPTHAFDAARLAGQQIQVRFAQAGETLRTLDGVERALREDDLVIADAERALVVAGVMGGLTAEITPETTELFLECAYFEPSAVRRTGRRLGLSTDSSYRFERGVDPAGIARALDLLTALVLELGGGEMLETPTEFRQTDFPAEKTIEFHLDSLERLVGVSVPNPEVERILAGLGYGLKRHTDGVFELNSYDVTVPGWRWHDTTREVDLVEEVTRHWGYERIPACLPAPVSPPTQPATVQLERKARAAAIAMGLTEVMTRSLTTVEAERLAGQTSGDHVRLSDPLKEMTVMRTALLPGLLEVLRYNRYQGCTQLGIFEIGRTYRTREGEPPQERLWLGGAVMGSLWQGLWLPEHTPSALAVDFFYAKGLLEAMLAQLGVVGELTFQQAEAVPGCHPGQAALAWLDGAVIGSVGAIHPQVARDYDFPPHVGSAAFFLDLDALAARPTRKLRYQAFGRQPAILRDLAVLAPRDLAAQDALAVIQAHGGAWLEKVTMFDRFTGPGIPEEKASLAFSLVYRSPERTLTAQDIEPIHQGIVDQLHTRFGAVLRS
ncbi:MAG: phenylalanine--tRNA ligase subunit beta [Candidatus Sericytochromatia bacterium]|nr:phenylalanine--tRNA ligase subunit beta [Candidatus Sericytochromatia bacterium]